LGLTSSLKLGFMETEKPTGSDAKKAGVLQYFHGPWVWSGIVMTVGGYLCEEFVGSDMGFEFFMFFGGLNLGMGLGFNIKAAQGKS